jgi:TolB-like protein/Tfp pilus assembly protein PilF
VAVLPIENLTGNPQQDYLSDGLTEELITTLSRMNPRELGVIARTSAMTYKGTRESVRNIGRQLGVDYVVEGSVRQEGDRYRVAAQLIRTHDEVHLWAQTYDREAADLLALQSEVALALADGIHIRLAPTRAAFHQRVKSPTPEAYLLYLRGRYQMNRRSREGLEQAVTLFEQAVEKDPGFARAHSGLADAYLLLAWYGHISNRQGFPRALAASQKALSLDSSLAEAHTTTAFLNSLWLTDWSAAERGFQTAIELDPAYVTAHHWYALHLTALNRLDEAIREMEEAARMDPLSPAVRSALAYVLYFTRQHDRAIAECETALSLAPDFAVAHAVQGWAMVEARRYEPGIQAQEAAVRLSGGLPHYLATLGRGYALAGRKDDAVKVLEEMERASQSRWIAPSEWAIVHAALGEADAAFERLSKSPEEGDGFVLFLQVAPEFDPLRSDPRFEELLRRMDLPRQLPAVD